MQTILSRKRSINVRASSSPLERHQANVRKFVKDIQNRRMKAEKSNVDFIMNLKSIFNGEVEYFKSICNPTVESKEATPDIVENKPDVIISDSYDDDIHNV